jgi:predicted PurR-regulated permease PerM
MSESVSRRLQRPITPLPESTLNTVLIGVIVVAALYFGREVLVPIALAILLTFVLAPLVRLLQRWHFPRIVAVMLVCLIAFAAIFGLGALMVSQVNQLARNLPGYQSTLGEKIQSLQGVAGGTGTLERASEVLKDLGKEIDRPNNSTSPNSLTEIGTPDKPIPVEIKQPDPGALQTLVALITPLIHPLTTTGIVAVFVIFILMQRQDLRNRLVRLAGAQDLQRTTAALDDAGQRLSRLFLTQLAVNACFGCVIGAGLWIIGVPSAPLWGMLAMIMRFVPYIGALISAIFPLVLSAAVGPGWTMVIETAALFLVAETIVGQAVEPLVYGQSTGLSPVAVIISATFWTWLWGPVGLILATPLSMCLVVVGRHVDRLEFLEVMFGDRPPLTPAELIYQRMLANDPIEAAEQARMFLKGKPLIEYYDEILLEGLKLAEGDSNRGLLNDERMHRIRDAVAEIVDDLDTHKDYVELIEQGDVESEGESPLAHLDKAEGARAIAVPPERWRNGHPVLCIPGAGLLDEAAAILVAQLIERRGIGARAEQPEALSLSRILSLDTKNVALICLCYVGRATRAQIGYAIRRIRRKAPDAFILVSIFGNDDSIEEFKQEGKMGVALQSLHTTVDKIVAAVVRMDTNSDLASLVSPLPTMAADRDGSRINS